jgi:hypothetical protein
MRSTVPIALLALITLAAPAAAQLFDFSLQPGGSGLAGTMSFDADTSGTLIGNWDKVSNPGGTRTKPGIFGTFEPNENVPVPMQLGLRIGGPINSPASGGFRLDVQSAAGQLTMTSFAADFLQGGPVTLPITLDLLYDSFRTRAPNSTYIGGIPLPIPFGEAALVQLTAQQIGVSMGALTPTGPGTYDFVIAPQVALTAEFSVLNNSFVIPGTPILLPLQGQLTVSGTTAHLVSIRPLEFSSMVQPNIALPQFPFELPTILPAGEIAHLLMNLTLTQIASGFDGTLALTSSGTLVPAPAAALLLPGLLLARRRR